MKGKFNDFNDMTLAEKMMCERKVQELQGKVKVKLINLGLGRWFEMKAF